MNTAQDTIVQLNKYPPDKYNVLVPVTSMQALSNMQRIIVNEVSLDTTVENGSGREIYYDKQTGKYAITAIGGARLAAAANISIVHTESVRTDVCEKCIEMAKATGNVQACGSCPHVYDVKMVVTVRVPEPSGGFRMISKSKEIDCSIEKASQSEKQYRKFLPHRASIAETKAFMRCIRSALGLAQGYTMQELKKPFIIAHIVPNLDAPEMRNALINNSLRDMGLLFERPSEAAEQGSSRQFQEPAALPGSTDTGGFVGAAGGCQNPANNYTDGGCYTDADASEPLPWDVPSESQSQTGFWCADCGREITEATGRNGSTWTPDAIKEYSEKRFGRCLCTDCQKRAKGGQTR